MLLAGNSNIITGITEMKRPELDRFGGWAGKRFKATGFFRLEKDEDGGSQLPKEMRF